MSFQPHSLYHLSVKAAVAESTSTCKFCEKKFRVLPDHVLFDFYYRMFEEKRLCLLSSELRETPIFRRLLRTKHKRIPLLRVFQALIDHSEPLVHDLTKNFILYYNQISDAADHTNTFNLDNPNNLDNCDNLLLEYGGFLNEGGWYDVAIIVFNAIETRRLTVPVRNNNVTMTMTTGAVRNNNVTMTMTTGADRNNIVTMTTGTVRSNNVAMATIEGSLTDLSKELVLKTLLECYHRRIYAETQYCRFKEAAVTQERATETIDRLRQLTVTGDGKDGVPNLAALYANFSRLYFMKSEYDYAYNWAQRALELVDDTLPCRVVINVLRHSSNSCVVKRRFAQAGLLIRQAASLATSLYTVPTSSSSSFAHPFIYIYCCTARETSHHPAYADLLMDYGYYLMHSDAVRESVRVYKEALEIRERVFDRNNVQVAVNLEDLAYACYVREYSSGMFKYARESIDKAIRIMRKILPAGHLVLASAIRVKALIIEEMALDLHDAETRKKMFSESEELHMAALNLSLAAFGERNVQTAKHYGNLGRLYQSMTMYEDAERMHLKAIEIKEQLLGPNDYEVGLSLGHLASLYNFHMHRHTDAERLYLRSIAISRALFGDTYSGLEYDYRGLIHVYTETRAIDAMLDYTAILHAWRVRRSEQVPSTVPDKPRPMGEVLAEFFGMCKEDV